MSENDLQSLLRAGIQAARNGNKQMARRIFEQVLEIDDRNELAWLWMASVVDSARERRICLENVLEINPQNERAAQALEKLPERGAEHAAKSPERPAKETQPAPPKTEPRRPVPSSADDIDLEARLAGTPRREAPDRTPTAERPALRPPVEDGVDLSARLGGAPPRQARDSAADIDWRESEWIDAPAPPLHDADRREPARERLAADFGEEPLPSGPPRRRRRRLTRVLMLLIGGLAVIAVVAVAALLIRQRLGLDAGQRRPTPAPATLPPTEVFIVALGSETPVPTWTPLPSPTTPPTVTPPPARTPLGNYTMAFSALMDGQRRESIYTIAANGDEESLAQLTADTSRDLDPSVSPDGSRIVYVSDQSGVPELYLIGVQSGAEPVALTQLGAETLESPAWSPDGTRLAFSAVLAEGNQEIYVIDVNTPGEPVQLTTNTAIDKEPVWSPDGRAVAFASDRTGRGFLQIYTVPSECNTLPGGCEAHTLQLTQSQNSSMSPAWSPDGQYIAFVSNRVKTSDNDIYVMRADGMDARLLTLDQFGDNGANDLDPVWSHDGQWIAFASDRGRVGFQIYAVSPDGTDVFQITSDASSALFPSWFP